MQHERAFGERTRRLALSLRDVEPSTPLSVKRLDGMDVSAEEEP